MNFRTNFILLTWIALANALEILMVVVVIGLHFPPVSHLSNQVFPEVRSTILPKHETLYYRFFIVMAFGIYTMAFMYFRRQLQTEKLTDFLKRWAVVEAVWMFLLISAAFQALAYMPRYQLAFVVFKIVLIASFLQKMFFNQTLNILDQGWKFVTRETNAERLRWLLMIGSLIFITAIIAVVNPQAAVARFFVGEQFHHNDSFMMGPVWVVASGLVPNWDVISQYGFGFPYIIAALAKCCGGISYETVLQVMVSMTIVYYMGWFLLLRRWYNSVVLALATVILGIKWQMFHPGVYPFVFTYGSTTPVRYFVDVLFFTGIYQHLITKKNYWFWLAGSMAGVQLWYLTSEGVYLSFTWWSYIICLFLECVVERQKVVEALQSTLVSWIIPLVTAAVLLICMGGQVAFRKEFWFNVMEFSQYFLSGFGVMPMTTNLTDKEFGAALMGFIIPIAYISTVIIVSAMIYWKRLDRRAWMAVLLSIYGLGLYHYYVTRSSLTAFLVGALPFTWVISFWLKYLSDSWGTLARRKFFIFLLMGACYALFTTHLFLAYPNVFNLSRNPYTDLLVAKPLKNGKPYFDHLFREFPEAFKFNVNVFGQTDDGLVTEADFSSDRVLVNYYRQMSDFKEDVALIQRYSKDGERVPLISSFEIKMLMDAHRKPYFYYFPLVISRPMTMRSLAKSSIYTIDQLQKTINALERDRPPYLFMEKIFTARPLPEYFYQEYTSFLLLRDYVLKNYQPVDAGKYLLAFKMKGNT